MTSPIRPPANIPIEELNQLITQGLSIAKIAEHFHVAVSTIGRLKRKLAEPTAGHAQKQLAELRIKIRRILKRVTTDKKPNDKMAILASREIRGQMKLELEIAKTWMEYQAIEDWKKELLEVIRTHTTEDQWVAMLRDWKAMQVERNVLNYRG